MFLFLGHHNRTFLRLLCTYGANGRGQACVDTVTPCKLQPKATDVCRSCSTYTFNLPAARLEDVGGLQEP